MGKKVEWRVGENTPSHRTGKSRLNSPNHHTASSSSSPWVREMNSKVKDRGRTNQQQRGGHSGGKECGGESMQMERGR
jgi:hypothetical protein